MKTDKQTENNALIFFRNVIEKTGFIDKLRSEAPEQDGQPPKETKEHGGGTESKEIETPSRYEAGGPSQKSNIML